MTDDQRRDLYILTDGCKLGEVDILVKQWVQLTEARL